MEKSRITKFKRYHFVIMFSITLIIYFIYLIADTVLTARQGDSFLDGSDIVVNEPTYEAEGDENESVEAPTVSEETTKQQEDDTKEITDISQNDRPAFTTVDLSYLDGALFIGDSRTMTLSEYAGWDNTHFFVETGLTIWTVMDSKTAKVNGKSITVRDALQSKSYDKIYIMLGINELGRGTPDTFCTQYQSVIDEIKSLQPDSIVYIQSIMHVTQSKDDKNTYINNHEINMRNDKIKAIADGKNVFWLDVNEVFDAREVNKLNSEYTSDGVHLKPTYIPIWRDFLLSHAIVR